MSSVPDYTSFFAKIRKYWPGKGLDVAKIKIDMNLVNQRIEGMLDNYNKAELLSALCIWEFRPDKSLEINRLEGIGALNYIIGRALKKEINGGDSPSTSEIMQLGKLVIDYFELYYLETGSKFASRSN